MILAAVSATVAVTQFIGCAGTSPPPDISAASYAGPELRVEAKTDRYLIVAATPTPGWLVRLDRVIEDYGHESAFVSLRQPNPAYSYAMVRVEQRVATNVPSSHRLAVYARVLSFDADKDSDDAYCKAITESPAEVPKDAR